VPAALSKPGSIAALPLLGIGYVTKFAGTELSSDVPLAVTLLIVVKPSAMHSEQQVHIKSFC